MCHVSCGGLDNTRQALLNSLRVIALWGDEIVALAEEITEYERLIASSIAAQSQFDRVAQDLETYERSRQPESSVARTGSLA